LRLQKYIKFCVHDDGSAFITPPHMYVYRTLLQNLNNYTARVLNIIGTSYLMLFGPGYSVMVCLENVINNIACTIIIKHIYIYYNSIAVYASYFRMRNGMNRGEGWCICIFLNHFWMGIKINLLFEILFLHIHILYYYCFFCSA
jgi:hypothetical protein